MADRSDQPIVAVTADRPTVRVTGSWPPPMAGSFAYGPRSSARSVAGPCRRQLSECVQTTAERGLLLGRRGFSGLRLRECAIPRGRNPTGSPFVRS